MSNALVSKNSNYELLKQQTKSSGSAIELRVSPQGEWYVIIFISKDIHVGSVGNY